MEKIQSFQKIKNNNTITNFEYPQYETYKNTIENEWSKIESNLQKSRLDDCFSNYERGINECCNSINIDNIKSMDWGEITNQYQITENKNDSMSLYKIQEANMELNLQKLIHPIDNEFETYISNKLEELEKLKPNKLKTIINLNNRQSTFNTNTNNSNQLKQNIFNLFEGINNNNSLIKEKNETNIFNKNSDLNLNYCDDSLNIKKHTFLDNSDEKDNNKYRNNNYQSNTIDLTKKNMNRLMQISNKLNPKLINEKLVNAPNKINRIDLNKKGDGINIKISKLYRNINQEDEDQMNNNFHYENNKVTKDKYFNLLLNKLNQ